MKFKGNDGIEPSTFWLTANCSTTELITLIIFNYNIKKIQRLYYILSKKYFFKKLKNNNKIKNKIIYSKILIKF